MPLDIFRLRDRVVEDYSQYVDSFIKIGDDRLNAYVAAQLRKGELWPDPVLQLNPAYKMAETLDDLAQGDISPETARFFGPDLTLYRHQRDAIDLGLAQKSYVVTTGTGSGKSLTYLIPIVERIFREDPSDHNVRALLIYPMNALINSQLNALKEYAANYPDCPIRFARYTGETKHDEREQIHADPPHILLTNYVMAELMLQRPTERRMLSTATRALRTLVMDELHFYRGRQGADVAMLTRRLQQQGRREFQVIGTSATMSSGSTPTKQREEIAGLATKFFGQPIPADQIIGETLARVTEESAMPADPAALRAAVEAPPPEATKDAVQNHPLAAWAEETFGIEQGEEGLIRRAPITESDAVDRLAEESGCERAECERALRAVLKAGNEAVTMRGSREEPVFAFRLHQWLASGGSIYSTLSPAGEREFRMERGYKDEQGRVLFPLAFCRECGQDYYLVERRDRQHGEHLKPREPLSGRTGSDDDEDERTEGGFFALDALEEGGLWSGSDEDLPDGWFDQLKSGPRIKKNRADFRPRRYHVNTAGDILGDEGGTAGWFMAAPFMFCLRCRHAYDRTGSDYRRLASLSQTGRSTATTVAVNATVAGIEEQNVAGVQAKALSFTDNRQDASLQAGHLNDFAQVALLRSALAQAVREHGPLGFGELGQRVFEALDPAPADFLKDPVASGPGHEQGRRAMIDLLEYRALEDLARGWRVNQPNLEQAGLLRIEYEGLDELSTDDSRWAEIPLMREAEAETREKILHAILDRLRIELVIDAPPLERESLRRLTRNAAQWLGEPWALDETDANYLRRQQIALLPGEEPRRFERSPIKLTARSAITRFLRSRAVWGRDVDLGGEGAEQLAEDIVTQLVGQVLSAEREGGRIRGVRVNAGAMRWAAGDGTPVPDDPVRQRMLPNADAEPKQANKFFTQLYGEPPGQLRRMLADAHTGQIATEARQERERRFREGALPALFCSPTMELGVDIADLNAVHLRNVPPTPANYAQRSGRAGRNGNPALILAFAAQGNAHDQYFFKRRNEMIAGSVEPARIDLQNEELVRAHLHAIWIGEVGVNLEGSIRNVLDLGDPEYPLQESAVAQVSDSAGRRAVERARESAQRVVDGCTEIQKARWYRENWVADVLNNAGHRFDRAFDDWRQLYREALAARDEARREMDDPYGSNDQIRQARQREERVGREIRLLLNDASGFDESDYYPYRYLATAGFLPGYNFPRLPVRVSVAVRDGVQHITRPRFLGLTEFGPGNLIYHEGRRHRVDAAVVPANGFEWKKATFCNACGHAHDGDDENERELCGHCGARLDGASESREIRLLPQPTMRARPVDRISSDEEERTRNGYKTSIHFDQIVERDERTASADGESLLDLEYAPAARLWQINHKWKSAETDGFEIVEPTGEWIRQTASVRKQDGKKRISGIKPFVRDTRNLLFLRPRAGEDSDMFLVTLQHALQRAIEIKYQLEEQEIAADRIGEGEYRRLLFWEASEGGSGVWEQLIDPRCPGEIAKVARKALALMHYNPETGEDDQGDAEIKCSAGCYECLLSYANQLDHAEIDRRIIREYLVQLAGSTVEAPSDPDRDARYRYLAELVDSSFERKVLNHLHAYGHRLPDSAQARPAEGIAVQVDFFYKRENANGACVFVDGPAHDDSGVHEGDSRKSEELEDRGFRVIRITYARPLDEQIAEHADVFGEPAG